MNDLQPSGFREFLYQVHGHRPFPWQQMLIERIASDGWPEGIDLPTASGKTVCIDVAVFALAMCASQGLPPSESAGRRRIFFVVDRRIVVDEAYDRARRLADRLASAQEGVAKGVADALRAVGGTEEPLVASRMRGGTLRDDAWRLSPTQPAVITSTVDQVGSRMLFRSYGSGVRSAPIEAGLVACDSLFLLDEAHCAVPFLQTARSAQRYGGPTWNASGGSFVPPLMVSVLSATLPKDIQDVFPGPDCRGAALDCEPLKRRTTAAKSAEVALANKPGKRDWSLGEPVSQDPLVLDAAQRAADLAASGSHRRIAVMVNRVAAAASIHGQLCGAAAAGTLDAEPVLMTGRMRPLDRDELVAEWSPVLRAGSEVLPERPVILVTTQCLEVGADFSFDALVTECASLDALRQRFGRLNRLGEVDNTQAAVLARKRDTKPDSKLADDTPLDPIYGNALARTWNWLNEHAEQGRFDFGIEAVDGALPSESTALLAPTADAPVLLPAHLDLLCQTAPTPVPDPDVALFLHGPKRNAPEVRIVFRADLVPGSEDAWPDAITALPPVAAEALRVPLWLLRRVLSRQPGGEEICDLGDVEGQPTREGDELRGRSRPFVIWRGRRDTVRSHNVDDIRPSETVVVPASEDIVAQLGCAFARPSGAPLDLAERAYVAARRQHVLRLAPGVLRPWRETEPVAELLKWSGEEDRLPSELPELLSAVAAYQGEDEADVAEFPPWLTGAASSLAHECPRVEPHPAGVVLFGPPASPPGAAVDLETGDDDDSLSGSNEDVSLPEHTRHVVKRARNWARLCLPEELSEAFISAAMLHDLGKADPRFQIVLHGDETRAAVEIVANRLLAKSRGTQRSTAEQRRLRSIAELPEGFRHEMLSLQLVEALNRLPEEADIRDLLMHLIASHHGHGRPFAPVVNDLEFPDVAARLNGETFALSHERRTALTPPHRLDSGVAERFWRLTRRYGWWQLGYLESVLRLADRAASAAEAAAHKHTTQESSA